MRVRRHRLSVHAGRTKILGWPLDASAVVGRRVQVQADGLFEEPVDAVVVAEDPASKSLLLQFSRTVVIGSEQFEFAVSRGRNEQQSFDILCPQGTVGCALTCVPASRYDPSRPFDVSWWRGGAAAIADLVLP